MSSPLQTMSQQAPPPPSVAAGNPRARFTMSGRGGPASHSGAPPPPPPRGYVSNAAAAGAAGASAAKLAEDLFNTNASNGRLPPPPMTTNALRSPQASPQKQAGRFSQQQSAGDKENAASPAAYGGKSTTPQKRPMQQQPLQGGGRGDGVTFKVLGENKVMQNSPQSSSKQQAKAMINSRANSNIRRSQQQQQENEESPYAGGGGPRYAPGKAPSGSPSPSRGADPRDHPQYEGDANANEEGEVDENGNYSSKFFGKYLYLKSFRVKPQTPSSEEKKLRKMMRPAHRRGLCVSPNALKEQMKVYHSTSQGHTVPPPPSASGAHQSRSVSPSRSPSSRHSAIPPIPSVQRALAAKSESPAAHSCRQDENNLPGDPDAMTASPNDSTDVSSLSSNSDSSSSNSTSDNDDEEGIRVDVDDYSDIKLGTAAREDEIIIDDDDDTDVSDTSCSGDDESGLGGSVQDPNGSTVARSLIVDMTAASMSPSLKAKKKASGTTSPTPQEDNTVTTTATAPPAPQQPSAKVQPRSLLDILGDAAALGTSNEPTTSTGVTAAGTKYQEGAQQEDNEVLHLDIDDDDFTVVMDSDDDDDEAAAPSTPPKQKASPSPKKASPPRSPKPEELRPVAVAKPIRESSSSTTQYAQYHSSTYRKSNYSERSAGSMKERVDDDAQEEAMSELDAAINRRAEKHFAAYRRMEKHYLDEYHHILATMMITPFSRLEDASGNMIPWEDARKLRYGKRTMLDEVMDARTAEHSHVHHHYALYMNMRQWMSTLYLDNTIVMFENHIRFLSGLQREAEMLKMKEDFDLALAGLNVMRRR